MRVETSGAISDWQDRQTLYEARSWKTLRPHINPALTAVKGLVRSRDNLQAFAQSMREYGQVAGNPDTQARLEATASEITTHAHRESVLEIPLMTADDLIRQSSEKEELEALTDPAVARAFVHEALVGKPRFGPRISPEECAQVLAFSEEVRPSDDKIGLCARLVYVRSSTMTAEGIYDWLQDAQGNFNQQTPLEIIENGSDEMNAELFAWAAAARS